MRRAQKTSDQDDVIAWAVRTSDPAFADWPAFAAWLDGDPERNLAYDRAMRAVAEAAAAIAADMAADAPLPALPIAAAPVSRGRRLRPLAALHRRRRLLMATGMVVAASLAAVLLLPAAPPAPLPTTKVAIEAPADRMRSVTLVDGSRIDVAAGGRVLLDRARHRDAMLVRGRAVFNVRHDDAAPFRVTAGGHQLVDAGTAFEVVIEPGAVEVAVAEGMVIVDPSRTPLPLVPGKRVRLKGGAKVEVASVPPATIGQWRNGRMTYRDVPLSRVAAELSASIGRPIAISPVLAARRFTGTLLPASLRDRPDEMGALLEVRVRRDMNGWNLHER